MKGAHSLYCRLPILRRKSAGRATGDRRLGHSNGIEKEDESVGTCLGKHLVRWVNDLCSILSLALSSFMPLGKDIATRYGVLFFSTTLPWRSTGRTFPAGEFKAWIMGRPLRMVSYWVNFQISRLNTYSYYSLNLLLHLQTREHSL